MANSDGIVNIALTPIGTGAAGIDISVFADALAEDTVNYLYLKASSLREV